MTEQWAMYGWAAAVALAIAAGAWTAVNRREVRPVLALEHAAGAALIGLFGWEMLVYLPGSVLGYWTLTAGLGDPRGVEAQQLFVVAQAAFAVGAAVAIGGILRRRTWGAVLGIGLAFARVVWSSLVLFDTTTRIAESMPSAVYLDVVLGLVGLQTIPALAAIALLAWPLTRRSTPGVDVSDRDRPAMPA